MSRKEKRWLLLLKGTVNVDSLTEAEVKELLREKHLYDIATDAVGIALDLDDIFAEKKLKRECAKMPPQRLLAFRAKNERAKRRFLKRHMYQEAPTEDSRFERLEWKGTIIHNALTERGLLRDAFQKK